MRRSIAELQKTLPWGAHGYNAQFLARTEPHRDFAHAVLHIHKALGKLHGLSPTLLGDYHAFGELRKPKVGKYLADILICAARAANTYPGRALRLTASETTQHSLGDTLHHMSSIAVELDESVDLAEHEDSVGDAAKDRAGIIEDALSDIVDYAEQAALSYPGTPIDLDAALDARLAEKFPPQPASAS